MVRERLFCLIMRVLITSISEGYMGIPTLGDCFQVQGKVKSQVLAHNEAQREETGEVGGGDWIGTDSTKSLGGKWKGWGRIPNHI